MRTLVLEQVEKQNNCTQISKKSKHNEHSQLDFSGLLALGNQFGNVKVID